MGCLWVGPFPALFLHPALFAALFQVFWLDLFWFLPVLCPFRLDEAFPYCCLHDVVPGCIRVVLSVSVLPLALARPWHCCLGDAGVVVVGISLAEAGRFSDALSFLRLVAVPGGLRQGPYRFFHLVLLVLGFVVDPVRCWSCCVLGRAFLALVFFIGGCAVYNSSSFISVL